MNGRDMFRFRGILLGFLLIVSGLIPGCVGPRRVSDKDIRVVSMSQVAAKMDAQLSEPDEQKLLLIDSRSKAKYDAGHIPGARHMLLSDESTAMKRDEWIDSFDEIVIYADNPGSASAKALVKRMLTKRYDDVRLFPGGYAQWTKAGLPTETAE